MEITEDNQRKEKEIVLDKEKLANKVGGFGVEIKGKTIKELEENIIEFRQKQTRTSRFIEYITGLRPDNPVLIPRLIADHYVVRAKYGLPSWEYVVSQPVEYQHQIEEKCKTEGISLRPTNDLQKFFEKIPALAFYSRGNIFADVLEGTGAELRESVFALEHEYIHALQDKRYPRIPREVSEYEAYITSFNPKGFEKITPEALEVVFNLGIIRSIRLMNKEKGEKTVWENSDFWINKDRRDCSVIE